MPLHGLHGEDLERFLRERLARPLPGPAAHGRFAPRPPRRNWQPGIVPESARPAAALILIYPGADGPTIPLTVRQSDMAKHAGQISLPGGRVDAGETPEQAALREAHEEIGVDPATVRVLGRLTTMFVVVSNYAIEPFVAVCDARPDFSLAPGEVAELIEAPLARLLDPAHLKWGTRTREGYLVDHPYFDVAGHQVWGATAMILGEFVELFGADGIMRQ